MRVLRTAAQHRRHALWTLVGASALAVLFAAVGFAWRVARPGAHRSSALGVRLPDGSRSIYEERAHGDDPFRAVYVSSTRPPEEALRLYSRRGAEVNRDARRVTLPDGTTITVAPAGDVPATHLSPIHPVYEGVPLGTRSWIVVSRGRPPSSTWSVSVPPQGAS